MSGVVAVACSGGLVLVAVCSLLFGPGVARRRSDVAAGSHRRLMRELRRHA